MTTLFKKKEVDIKKMNQKFASLSTAKQREMIILDALHQIKLKKMIPSTGKYLVHSLKYTDDMSSDLQQNLLKPKVTCECCAKGALFMACVLNEDKVDENARYNDSWFIRKKLERWFSREELNLMETAFERKGGLIDNSLRSDDYDAFNKAKEFGKKYSNSTTRLVGILKNTLKYGQFDPWCGKEH